LKQGLPEQVIEAEARSHLLLLPAAALNPPLGSCPGSLHFIPPGQPWRNGSSSRSSRVRDECLNINIW
jgi:hypothetical protein